MSIREVFDEIESAPWYVRWGFAALIALFLDGLRD